MLVRTVATKAGRGRRCTELEGEKGSIPVLSDVKEGVFGKVTSEANLKADKGTLCVCGRKLVQGKKYV